MHQRLAALRMRGHHHPGRLLMHLAQTISMLQGPTILTTVHLMHQDPEVVALVTTLTVLRRLPLSQLEEIGRASCRERV